MRKLLLAILGIICIFPICARTFTYEYEGQTLTYTVVDEEAKTCKTQNGDNSTLIPGNEVIGNLIIPEVVNDGENNYTVVSIGAAAFCNCEELTSIVLPNTISLIGDKAFYFCKKLKSITIPTGLSIINDYCFAGCTALTSIELPNTVIEIRKAAFSGCTGLSNVTLSNSLTTIKTSAFSGCSALVNIVVPNSVTSIGSSAFSNCTALVEIEIPNSVITIDNNAFYGCTGLTSFIFPSSISTINSGVLSGCSSIRSVSIPSSVTSIQSSAFSNCTKLYQIEIPNSVTTIESSVFNNCKSLYTINIPSSIKSIENSTFYGSGLSSISIPNSITKIGKYAFYGCSRLNSVEIPNSIETIEESTFANCSELNSVILPNSITTIGLSAFNGCAGLSTLELPSSVTTISSMAFAKCNNLESLIIPASVKSIDNNAFYECVNFKKVAYPNTMTNPFRSGIAFAYDPNEMVIENNVVLDKNKTSIFFVLPTVPKDYVMPATVTKICEDAFKDCWLRSLTLPASIKLIESDAFADCSINRVNFIDWNAWYTNVKLENLRSNPYRNSTVYAGGVQITTPILFEGLTEIKDFINYGLSFKDEVDLPSTLKRVGAFAFYNNTEVYDVFLNEGLEEIGESAFEGCELLESPIFPTSLKKIEDRAYLGCSAITEIELPKGLNTLGDEVFMNCTSIDKTILVSNIVYIGKDVFNSCRTLSKVYFPHQLRTIGSRAFWGCLSLADIILPSTLLSIGEEAFKNCGLRSLILPENVNSIGTGAFSNNNISTISLSKKLNTIPPKAFQNNPIKLIEFNNELEVIRSLAFAGSSSISSVILPETVNLIEENAFQNANIAEMVIPDGITALPVGSCGNPAILTLGSGLKTLDSNAFQFSNLHVLRVKSTTPPTLNNSFNISSAQNDALTLIVNQGRKDKFTTNARWRSIDQIIEEGSSEVTIYMTGDYALSEEIRTTTGLMPASVTSMKVVGPLTDADLRIIKENMVALQKLDLSGVTNLTSIPNGQFQNSILTEIVLPKVLLSIGNNAFANCPLLKIDQLPEGLKIIGDKAFFNSPSISITRLPNTLESIGSYSFSRTRLQHIIGGPSLSSIGEGAFESCDLLQTCDFSSTSILEIPDKTFRNCTSLDEVNLSNLVESIGKYSFANTDLHEIEFANSITSIGEGAFSQCLRLVTANIPENISIIRDDLFSECPRLITATMGGKVRQVGSTIFNGNSRQANISCAALEAPEATSMTFEGVRLRNVTLTVPTTSYRSYLNAPQWGKFTNIQNRIPVTISTGIDVSCCDEKEYQNLIKEDELEEAEEEASKIEYSEVGEVNAYVKRRASLRKEVAQGRSFARLFDGAQIMTGNEGGTRIFINPKENVTLSSIKYNGKEMLHLMDGNSILIPPGTQGELIISSNNTVTGEGKIMMNYQNESVEIFNLNGNRIYGSLEHLTPGIYILRSGTKVEKVVIK